jgi:hypothetical protein
MHRGSSSGEAAPRQRGSRGDARAAPRRTALLAAALAWCVASSSAAALAAQRQQAAAMGALAPAAAPAAAGGAADAPRPAGAPAPPPAAGAAPDNGLLQAALQFLSRNMPAPDRAAVPDSALVQTAVLALRARRATKWGRAVPVPVFLNDVLPYRHLDEPFEMWRRRFFEALMPLVANATSTSEAAQVGRGGGHTAPSGACGRGGGQRAPLPHPPPPRPPPSTTTTTRNHGHPRPQPHPARSSTRACGGSSTTRPSTSSPTRRPRSCRPARSLPQATPHAVACLSSSPARAAPSACRRASRVRPRSGRRGLLGWGPCPVQPTAAPRSAPTSLLSTLTQRLFPLPRRAARPGIPSWPDDRRANAERFNNHNWVEVWDGGAWSFTGACEFDPRGLNRTWFFPEPARRAVPGSLMHAIYAASFARTPGAPAGWARGAGADGAERLRCVHNLDPPRQ